MAEEFWTANLWLPIVATVVGGIVLAGVLAAFNRAVRDRFWRPLGRVLRWPLSLRVLTVGRIQRIERDGADVAATAEARARQFERDADDLRKELRQAREEINHSAAATAAIARLEIQQAASREREYGRQEGRAEALAQIAAERAALVTRPVWRITEAGPNMYRLDNVQPGVGAISDVSIDCPMRKFIFHGATQWPGSFGGMQFITGERTFRLAIDFTVRYRDENGDWHTGEAQLPKEPTRGIVL